MSLFDGSFCPEIPSPRQTAILPPPTKAFQGAMYTKSLGHRSVSTAGFRLKRVKDLALICISQGTHGRHRRHMYQKAHLEVPGTLVYQNSCQWNGHRPRGLSRCKLPFEGRGENTGQQRTTTTKTSATVTHCCRCCRYHMHYHDGHRDWLCPPGKHGMATIWLLHCASISL